MLEFEVFQATRLTRSSSTLTRQIFPENKKGVRESILNSINLHGVSGGNRTHSLRGHNPTL